MAETTGITGNAQDNGAGGSNTFPERAIDSSQVIWQALAAVIDGKDDYEGAKRLQALRIEELRVFRFQIDRIRTLIYNVQGRKMRDADLEARQAHEAEVKKLEKEENE